MYVRALGRGYEGPTKLNSTKQLKISKLGMLPSERLRERKDLVVGICQVAVIAGVAYISGSR